MMRRCLNPIQTVKSSKNARENMEGTARTYTIREAIDYLGVSDHQIYKAIYEKQLAAEKQGTKWGITQEALDAYYRAHVSPPYSVPPPGGTGDSGIAESAVDTEEITEEITVSNEIEETALESQAVEESDEITEDPWVSVPLSTVQALTARHIEESAEHASPTPSKINEAMRSIAQAETHLALLGVPMGRIDEIAVELRVYQEAQEHIIRARESQFCADARAVLLELDGNSDTRRVAAFLRQFAEHVTAHAVTIAKEVNGIEEIVDLMPCMEEINGSEENNG
jgi:excisionase family DNA binding protein